MRRRELTIKQILKWADAHHERTGHWPERKNGHIWETAEDRWRNIDNALRLGLRGLHRGSSLARLLDKHRGKRNRKQLPKFTLKQILAWADAHHARTGHWPRDEGGLIPGTRGETWCAVEMALNHGQRGLPGGSSLAKLLAAKRKVPNRLQVPRLSHRLILRWADAHKRRTGNWPTAESGAIADSPGDTWSKLNQALKAGSRGLSRGSSLFKLLATHRGIARHVRKRPVSLPIIVGWAQAYQSRNGKWPNEKSGAIPEAPLDTWRIVATTLRDGKRGLPKGMTLGQLRARERGPTSSSAGRGPD